MPMFNEGDLINNQYEVRRRLVGGMGCVYIAFDQVSERDIAIKTLREDFLGDQEASNRFEREARTWINLGPHEHVVRAVSFHRGTPPLFLLEYVDGPSLERLLIAEQGSLLTVEAIRFAIHIARALDWAHRFELPGGRKGIIHRDLKPGNVLITKSRIAKLTDFGLARACDDTRLTRSRTTMGTLPYMPPEQIRDTHSVTDRADTYSLGVVLYQMLAGRLPFERETIPQLMHDILFAQPEPVSVFRKDIELSLDRLIVRCLSKRPEDRPASAAVMTEELQCLEVSVPAEPAAFTCATCGYAAKHSHLQCPVCDSVLPPKPKEEAVATSRCACGNEVSSRYRFCNICGRPVAALNTCRSCGTVNEPRFAFCVRCGTRMTEG